MRTGKLTAMKVAALVKAGKPGYTGDGGGLYLQISKWGTPTWAFRYRVGDKLRTAGLGSLDTFTLAEVRERARLMRQQRVEGIDPIDDRRAKRAQAMVEAAKVITFRQAAEAYIAEHRATWKNPVHAKQWPSTLETYVYPVIGDLPVAAIDTPLVLKALEPIWTTKPETASRVRNRIELVLDRAKVRGHREGENPARWKGHLDATLPPPSKAKAAVRVKNGRDGHHAALPYDKIGDFMVALRRQEGFAARALEFLILTAARTGEVLGATWDEIDVEKRLWTIPAICMKAAREHRVPLSDAAMKIVKAMAAIRSSKFVFPGAVSDRPLSSMALLMTLRRMKRLDLTAHGFRSTFRDWAGERTSFPREVCEHALAHGLKDKTEAAYQRGDLFEKRAKLMAAWGKFCGTPMSPADRKVVGIGEAAA